VAISLDSLRRASPFYAGQRARSLTEAKARNFKTGFLCHSHDDANLVRGLVKRLQDAGLNLYVDWLDEGMPNQPDRETAGRIQRAIVQTDTFLFLATPNSMKSVWCPWEIGYANGIKPIDRIVVIPTVDSSGNYSGNEYLELYQRIDETHAQLEIFQPRQTYGYSLRTL
jgi:hypothetical protein